MSQVLEDGAMGVLTAQGGCPARGPAGHHNGADGLLGWIVRERDSRDSHNGEGVRHVVAAAFDQRGFGTLVGVCRGEAGPYPETVEKTCPRNVCRASNSLSRAEPGRPRARPWPAPDTVTSAVGVPWSCSKRLIWTDWE